VFSDKKSVCDAPVEGKMKKKEKSKSRMLKKRGPALSLTFMGI